LRTFGDRAVGIFFLVLGLGIYASGRHTLGKYFSDKVRFLPDQKLLTTGPLSLHPASALLGTNPLCYFDSLDTWGALWLSHRVTIDTIDFFAGSE
jgi:hypothetical protein